MKLESPLPSSASLLKVPLHPVLYDVATDKPGRVVEEHTAEAFRTAASRLLDRLDSEAKGNGGRVGVDWRRLRSIVEDAEADRTPWVAGMCDFAVVTVFTKWLDCAFRYPHGGHFTDSLARPSSNAIYTVIFGSRSLGYVSICKASFHC